MGEGSFCPYLMPFSVKKSINYLDLALIDTEKKLDIIFNKNIKVKCHIKTPINLDQFFLTPYPPPEAQYLLVKHNYVFN